MCSGELELWQWRTAGESRANHVSNDIFGNVLSEEQNNKRIFAEQNGMKWNEVSMTFLIEN